MKIRSGHSAVLAEPRERLGQGGRVLAAAVRVEPLPDVQLDPRGRLERLEARAHLSVDIDPRVADRMRLFGKASEADTAAPSCQVTAPPVQLRDTLGNLM